MAGATSVNAEACLRAASDSTLLATDLADYLVLKGVAFREAHHIVGAIVAFSEKSGKALNELTVAELKAIDSRIGKDALKVFNLATALKSRTSTGMPGTKQVAKQLQRWRKLLSGA